MGRIKATVFAIVAIIVLFIIARAGDMEAPWPLSLVAVDSYVCSNCNLFN